MKSTLEIPDAIFRRVKSAAAQRGIPLRALVTEALVDNLRAQGGGNGRTPWRHAFGKLRRLRRETARINRIIHRELDRIEPEVLE